MATRIRFGLIGCGAISQKHVEALKHLECALLVAVADKDQSRAAAVAARAATDWYTDYRFVLDRDDVDAVIIATPSGLHASMSLEALSCGKHVVVEKPMAMSLADADRMIEADDRAGRVLSVVHHNRFNMASQLLKRAIDEGRLGRLVWGSASVKWYRPQEYYDESGWRGTVSMDGGVLLNQAIHHIDLLLWYMGAVADVRAFRSTLGHKIEAEDTAVAALRFENGAIGSIDATTCAYPRNLEETITVLGECGSVVMGGGKLNNLRAWRIEGESDEEAIHLVQSDQPPKWYGHYKVLEDTVEAIREQRRPSVDGHEARKALELILGIYSCTPIARPLEDGGCQVECPATGQGGVQL